jgi:hypothetical protein
MEGSDSAREAAARRRAELGRRIRELHERNHELTSLLMGTEAGRGGSSPEQVRRAEELARLASGRAAEAASRAAAMYAHSATAHERAARMHLLLADAGTEDAGAHRELAQQHLQRAAEDRASAAALATGGHPDEPGAGQGQPHEPGGGQPPGQGSGQ